MAWWRARAPAPEHFKADDQNDNVAIMHPGRYLASVVILTLSSNLLPSCGYSEDEWQAQLAKQRDLMSQLDTEKKESAKLRDALRSEMDKVAMLSKKLEEQGYDISKLKSELDASGNKLNEMKMTLEEERKALAEYQAKAKQLEAIKARFETLKRKLDALTKLGLAVNIRNNRMVISLPGDVLFDSGRETLKKDGEDILKKVASVIRADQSLLNRYYQVAGHTDNKPYGGVFKDNWGLSLMRAREVLLYLVNNRDTGMPAAKWSAAGFGDTDPVADNGSDDGRMRNRRCDLIVVPSVEEMLDLKTIAN